jgi:hypothetical protein
MRQKKGGKVINPLHGKSFSWYSAHLEACKTEVERLRDLLASSHSDADYVALAKQLASLTAENERLRTALGER